MPTIGVSASTPNSARTSAGSRVALLVVGIDRVVHHGDAVAGMPFSMRSCFTACGAGDEMALPAVPERRT